MTWSDLIKLIRNELNLSQAQFAEILGLPTNTLRGWEYGNALPSKFYCDLFENLYQNIDSVKEALEQNRIQIPTIPERRNPQVNLGNIPQNQVQGSNLGQTVTKIAVGAGIAYGIFKLLSAIFSKPQYQQNQNQNQQNQNQSRSI